MNRTRLASVLILVSLVMLTSCTANVRSSSAPRPIGLRIGQVAVVVDVTGPCSKMIGGAASMAGPIPLYPRASRSQAFAFPPGGHQRVFESADSWQTIADWYRHAMPASAERRTKPECEKRVPHGMPPMEVAVFSVGTLGKDYRAVMISGLPANQGPNGWPAGEKFPRTLIFIQDR